MRRRGATTAWVLAAGLLLSTSAPVQASPGKPLAGGLLSTAAAMSAQSPQRAAQIEVLVLQGSNGPGGVAPGVANLPQLSRPPFNTYTQIALASRSVLALGAAPVVVRLPNEGTATITSQGRLPNGRYEVTVQLRTSVRTHNVQFSASPGDPFFTVASRGREGTGLILGFIVREPR
jgi:hypothetical protein